MSHTPHYSKPFEGTQTNMWDHSFSLSSCGYACSIAFIDDFTKYTWIYFLKQKFKALHAFKLFNVLIKT